MSILSKKKAISTGKQFASVVRSEIDSEALVVLFGSCTRDEANDRSDIDIAVMSKTFGDNVSENFAKLAVIAYGIDVEIEPHPFSFESWNYITPFTAEIRKTGVAL